MKYRLLILILLGLSLGAAGAFARAADISGTWTFSVDVASEPVSQTFVFKQHGETLTGTYSGGLGEHKVTGTVKGDKATFSSVGTAKGQAIEVSYTGTIQSPTKMTGTVEYRGGPHGKWTATKTTKK